MQVKKFMVGFEMLAQVQRDLTAEKVTNHIAQPHSNPLPFHCRLLLPSGHYPACTTRRRNEAFESKTSWDILSFKLYFLDNHGCE